MFPPPLANWGWKLWQVEISCAWCVIQKCHGPCRTLTLSVTGWRYIYSNADRISQSALCLGGSSAGKISDMEIWEVFLIQLNTNANVQTFTWMPTSSQQCPLRIQINIFSTSTADQNQKVGSSSPPLLSALGLFSYSIVLLSERKKQ